MEHVCHLSQELFARGLETKSSTAPISEFLNALRGVSVNPATSSSIIATTSSGIIATSADTLVDWFRAARYVTG